MVDTDLLLTPLCDISGSCLIGTEMYTIGNKPILRKRECDKLGILWEGRGIIAARFVWWQHHPETDRGYCLTLKCGNNRCVKSDHIQLGVWNPPRYISKVK